MPTQAGASIEPRQPSSRKRVIPRRADELESVATKRLKLTDYITLPMSEDTHDGGPSANVTGAGNLQEVEEEEVSEQMTPNDVEVIDVDNGSGRSDNFSNGGAEVADVADDIVDVVNDIATEETEGEIDIGKLIFDDNHESQ